MGDCLVLVERLGRLGHAGGDGADEERQHDHAADNLEEDPEQHRQHLQGIASSF